MWRYDATMSVYVPHMHSLQSTMWPETLVYIHFTLLAYAPQQMCLPLHVYCTLHIDPILLHISVTKPTKCTLIYHAIAIYVPVKNMFSNATCMPHAQIKQYISIREVGKNIWNTSTHWHQSHDKLCCTQKATMPTLTMQSDCMSWVGQWWIQPKTLVCMTV